MMLSPSTTLNDERVPPYITPHWEVKNLRLQSLDQHFPQLRFQRFRILRSWFAIANMLKLLMLGSISWMIPQSWRCPLSLIYLGRDPYCPKPLHLWIWINVLSHFEPSAQHVHGRFLWNFGLVGVSETPKTLPSILVTNVPWLEEFVGISHKEEVIWLSWYDSYGKSTTRKGEKYKPFKWNCRNHGHGKICEDMEKSSQIQSYVHHVSCYTLLQREFNCTVRYRNCAAIT